MAHPSPADNPYTHGLGEFVARLEFEHIPAQVRARIKLLILDSLGCALYAVHLPWSRLLMERLARLDTTTQCTVWGTSRRLSAPHAALVNGTLVQGFELDDVHRRGVLHVGAVTLPALLAVVESGRPLSGAEFVTAAVAGYEVGPRVGLCMGAEHIGQGWHSGATVGVFSAAAAAARGLGLTAEQCVHALGIAGTQSAGLMAAQYGAMVKRMHAGRAAQSGLYAAMLAQVGFTGIVNVFEAEYGGFCSTFSRSRDRFDLTQLTDGLGARWETLGTALKFYACVASNHTTLDAIRALRERRPFATEEVERIVVHAHRVTVDHAGWPYRPRGLTAAQLNLSYCVATLLLEGEVFVDQFSEERVADAARMALAHKVSCVEDPEITAMGRDHRHRVRVRIFLGDGTQLEKTLETARGSEQSFAPEADIVDKFHRLADRTLGRDRAEALRDAVLDLDELRNAADLARLLSGQD